MNTGTDSPVAHDYSGGVPHLWKFQPRFFHKIWGGDRLQTLLKKEVGDIRQCGESWELSDVPASPSRVSGGPYDGMTLPELLQRFGRQIMGADWADSQESRDRFPLLIKFLDARDDLSVQVHPDDVQAMRRHGCPGKTEMWYVLEADPGATLITGFRGDVDAESYVRALEEGRIMEVLNREPVQAGDVFFIPAGRIHTIGKGIVLAEIQQSSDITYRLYDFDRVDEQGARRALHTEEALDVLDFRACDSYRTNYTAMPDVPAELVNCPYFRTFLLNLTRPAERRGDHHRSFRVYMAVKGSGRAECEGQQMPLHLGDTILVAAQAHSLHLIPGPDGLTLLETGLPPATEIGA